MTPRRSPVLALLAVLLCNVLAVAQVSALSGGPVYPGGSVSTTGIYSGVMNGLLSNSLGLFTVSIPRSGLGTGTAAVFRNGYFFPGTIQAAVDPESASLSGLLDLKATVGTISIGTVGDNTVTLFAVLTASGLIRATISQSTSRFSRGTIRLNGTAVVSVSPESVAATGSVDPSLLVPVSFQIVGFKQAELTN